MKYSFLAVCFLSGFVLNCEAMYTLGAFNKVANSFLKGPIDPCYIPKECTKKSIQRGDDASQEHAAYTYNCFLCALCCGAQDDECDNLMHKKTAYQSPVVYMAPSWGGMPAVTPANVSNSVDTYNADNPYLFPQ